MCDHFRLRLITPPGGEESVETDYLVTGRDGLVGWRFSTSSTGGIGAGLRREDDTAERVLGISDGRAGEDKSSSPGEASHCRVGGCSAVWTTGGSTGKSAEETGESRQGSRWI